MINNIFNLTLMCALVYTSLTAGNLIRRDFYDVDEYTNLSINNDRPTNHAKVAREVVHKAGKIIFFFIFLIFSFILIIVI